MADLGTDIDPILNADIDNEDDVRFPIRKAAVAGWLYATTSQLALYVRTKLFGSLAGQAGKAIIVNGTEDGFEFGASGGGGGSGSGLPYVAPKLADFPTQLFFGPAGVTQVADTVEGMAMICGPNDDGTKNRMVMKAWPATPFEWIWKQRASFTSNADDVIGLMMRDSTSGRELTWGPNAGNSPILVLQRWNGSANYNGNTKNSGGNGIGEDYAYRFVDDGVDHKFYIGPSIEGPWALWYSQSRTAWLAAPDEIGFGIEDQAGNAQIGMLLVTHFEQL